MFPIARPKTRRFYELDLLRLFAALVVVVYHYAFRAGVDDRFTAMPMVKLGGLSQYGIFGVFLFFMISGFVILMSARAAQPRQFAVGRICRIYPAFWIGCTLTFTICLLCQDPRFKVNLLQYVANMTLLSDVLGARPIDGVYWTLFVELRFYLLIFLVLYFGLLKWIDALLGLWLLIAAALLVVPSGLLRNLLAADYAVYFIAGATFYRVVESGWSKSRIGMLSACFAFALLMLHRERVDLESHYGLPYDLGIFGALLALSFAAFTIVINGWTARWARPSWVKWGALTYPLYLIHQNIGYLLINASYPRLVPAGASAVEREAIAAVIVVILCVVMMAAAAVMHRYLERPIAHRLQQWFGDSDRSIDRTASADRPG